MKFSFIEYEIREDIAVLRLNDPPANTLTHDLMEQLEDTYLDIVANNSVKGILITGAGQRFFCGGVNIGMLANVTPHYNSNFLLYASEVMERIAESPLTVVAAINGHVTGGGLELALTARRRLAIAGDYNIGFPEVRLGVIPGLGGTQKLARLVGRQQALELITQGRFLSVAQARELGIFDEVLPADDFLNKAVAYTRRLAHAAEPVTRPSIKIPARRSGEERSARYRREGGFGIITLLRSAANIGCLHALRDLNAAILDARADEEMKVLLIDHEGDSLRLGLGDDDSTTVTDYAQFVFRRLENTPKVCVLLFSGALSGLSAELALACDYRYTTTCEACTGSLLNFLPTAQARLQRYRIDTSALQAEGRTAVDLRQALNTGVVIQVSPRDALASVMQHCQHYLPPNGATLSVGYAKLAVVQGTTFSIPAGLLLERHLQEQLFKSHDGPEGMKAYLDKRQAVFIGG